MTEAEREILEERLAIAVEHLKPETAQRIFDAVVAELESFESCGDRSQKPEARSQKAEKR